MCDYQVNYYLPFYCHLTQYSCFQSIMCQWDHQTPPIFDLAFQLMQTPEMYLPQCHQSTNYRNTEQRRKLT